MSAPYAQSPADEARDNLLRELSAELTRLTERVELLEDRQPPEGWTPSNYTCDADPKLCLARNSATGAWSVWSGAGTLAAGATPAAAVRALRGGS